MNRFSLLILLVFFPIISWTQSNIITGQVFSPGNVAADFNCLTVELYDPLSSSSIPISESTTDANGTYSVDAGDLEFVRIRVDGDEIIDDCEITFLDAWTIEQHVLQLLVFDDYQQFIAADVNGDQVIDYDDVSLLINILNTVADYPADVDIWRFLSNEYTRDDGENLDLSFPFQLNSMTPLSSIYTDPNNNNEEYVYQEDGSNLSWMENLQFGEVSSVCANTNWDFESIRTGDANMTCDAPECIIFKPDNESAINSRRSSGAKIEYKDNRQKKSKKGTSTLSIKLSTTFPVSGFSFGIEFDNRYLRNSIQEGTSVGTERFNDEFISNLIRLNNIENAEDAKGDQLLFTWLSRDRRNNLVQYNNQVIYSIDIETTTKFELEKAVLLSNVILDDFFVGKNMELHNATIKFELN